MSNTTNENDKLNKIMTEWNSECEIDPVNLDSESLKTPKLHAKYLRLYALAKLRYEKIKIEYEELESSKRIVYLKGNYSPKSDHFNNNFKINEEFIGMRIEKSEVPYYINMDEDIIKMSQKVVLEKETVDYLKAIVDSINSRSFIIKNAIDILKFKNGIK